MKFRVGFVLPYVHFVLLVECRRNVGLRVFRSPINKISYSRHRHVRWPWGVRPTAVPRRPKRRYVSRSVGSRRENKPRPPRTTIWSSAAEPSWPVRCGWWWPGYRRLSKQFVCIQYGTNIDVISTIPNIKFNLMYILLWNIFFSY